MAPRLLLQIYTETKWGLKLELMLSNELTNGLNQSRSLLEAGKAKAALLKLIKLSQSCSHHLDYLYLMADVQKALGDTKNQLKTLRLIQGNSQKVADKINFFKMCIYEGELRELNTAMATLDRATLNFQHLGEVLDIELELAIHYGEVEKIYACQRRFEEFKMTSARYFYSLALIDLKNNQESLALEHLRESLSLDPKMDTSWTALALLHHKLGDVELALANLQKALDSNPFNQTALKLFSSWSFDQIRMSKAESYLNFYLDRYSFDESITLNKISLLEKTGFDAAAECEYFKLQLYFGA